MRVFALSAPRREGQCRARRATARITVRRNSVAFSQVRQHVAVRSSPRPGWLSPMRRRAPRAPSPAISRRVAPKPRGDRRDPGGELVRHAAPLRLRKRGSASSRPLFQPLAQRLDAHRVHDLGWRTRARGTASPCLRRCRGSACRTAPRRRSRRLSRRARLHVVGVDLERRLAVHLRLVREQQVLVLLVRVRLVRALAARRPCRRRPPASGRPGCPCSTGGWCCAASRGRC